MTVHAEPHPAERLEEGGATRRWRRERAALVEAGLVIVLTVASLAVGAWVADPVRKLPGCNIVGLELALPDERPPIPSIDDEIRCGNDMNSDQFAAHVKRLKPALESSLLRDLLFVLVYVSLLFWLTVRASGWNWINTDVGTSAMNRRVARVAKWSVLTAGLLDLVENGLLWATSTNLDGPDNTVVSLTAAAATAKFVLLLLPVLIGLQTLVRLVAAGIRSRQGDPLVGHVAIRANHDMRRWEVPVDVDGTLTTAPVTAASDRYGVALSGGGIRSATFALGGLQILDSLPSASRWRLARAEYVSAVSGGSYMAAAYQFLAAQRNWCSLRWPEDTKTAPSRWARLRSRLPERQQDEAEVQPSADAPPAETPETSAAPVTSAPWWLRLARRLWAGVAWLRRQVFKNDQQAPKPNPADPTPRSSQLVPPAGDVEHHFRRHSMHLADGTAEWLMAIGEVAVKALSGLALLLLTVWVAGLPLGWFFRYVLHGVDAEGQPSPSIDVRIAAIPTFVFVVLSLARFVGADTNRTGRTPSGRLTLTRDGARETLLYATALTFSLAIALPFFTTNVEQSVDWVAQKVGLANAPEEPSRKEVLGHLAATIDGASAAADSAGTAAAAVAPAEVNAPAEADALSGARAAAELAAFYARESIEELAALIEEDDRADDLPLAKSFDPRTCTERSATEATAENAERNVANLACTAAVAAADAAQAAADLADAASTAGAVEPAAKAASAAAEASAGAIKAGNAVLALGSELKGVDEGGDGENPPVAWAGLSALVAAVGGVVGKRKLGSTQASDKRAKPKRDFTRKLGFGSRLEVLAGAVSVAVLVVAVSDVAVDAWQRGTEGDMKVVVEAEAWQWWLGALIVLLGALVFVNVNIWSLRPFYHRRLWLAYAVTSKGDTAHWWTETRLSTVGSKQSNFPELLVCAAAQTSGRDMAPPGRRALPFVFSARACGGPELGYVDTQTLEAVLGRERRKPITLFGAVATSGAAFGPAMGRHSKGGLGAIMAIANARLGTWLPNPYHLAALIKDGRPFRLWSLTTWPRLSYWLREIVGQYPVDAKLTLVTDGGHVENLGLLELLRRRCTRIICLDASGAGATPTTLAEAVALAREELGVTIAMRIPGEDEVPLIDIVNAGADPLGRKLDGESLAGRIAKHPVLEGRISYPAVGNVPASGGRLYYGTLALAGAGAEDWDVLEYAQRNPLFPNDGTDQQWFRADTFTAYQQLGRRTVERILEIADKPAR